MTFYSFIAWFLLYEKHLLFTVSHFLSFGLLLIHSSILFSLTFNFIRLFNHHL